MKNKSKHYKLNQEHENIPISNGMQEVGGSIPPGSTNLFKDLAGGSEAAKVP
jgi:hypothetical protein